MSLYEQLTALIEPYLSQALPQRSRCHPLMGYISSQTTDVWIKREDELNPTAIGTKLRKYLSLLPYLECSGCREVILIGGSNSNNVLGLCQLLRAAGVGVHVLVKQSRDPKPRGNWLYLNLLLPPDRVHPVSTGDWPQVETRAKHLAAELESTGQSACVIPEGGDHLAVLPGILTIALDLVRNEQTHQKVFDHIWTDAGTGISAIGLVLGLHFLEQAKRSVHITLIAGTESEFEIRYARYLGELERLLGRKLSATRPSLHFIRPITAASFGSLNQTTLNETRKIAQSTGLLMDPVYSVKHFYTVKKTLELSTIEGNQLIMYNGGTQGLNGFQSRLAPLVELPL